MWLPLVYPEIKCNTDGYGSPGSDSCGSIFRDYQDNFLGCFAFNIGISYVVNAEIMNVVLSIELAHEKGWSHL